MKDLDAGFEKARDAEGMDKYMYSFSPISEEAKQHYKLKHNCFCQGANWSRDRYLTVIKELIEALEQHRETFEWFYTQNLGNVVDRTARVASANCESKLAKAREKLG